MEYIILTAALVSSLLLGVFIGLGFRRRKDTND